MEQEGLIERVRVENPDGFNVLITALGRIELGKLRLFQNQSRKDVVKPTAIKVVPKGLRSYDEDDAYFFLELLPGPRDRNGLPESIRFWKRKIERTDADRTFRVGLIHGPSGCGKSSLVKAGLLPRLAKHVLSIQIEATADGTEARLLKSLRKNCPELSIDLGLERAVEDLSKGQVLPPGKKVLIVLDQFEQWLSTWRGGEEAGLIAAMRHCDGAHVQAIFLVRDDFWMRVNRFEKQVDVEFRRTLNSYGIDLFDPIHAKKVLIAFGRGFDQLRDDRENLSFDQRAFLVQAVEGLVEEGKIVPVRLSLFAWMVREKPWTRSTFREVGGTEGIGVNFLEEKFNPPHAKPNYRLHQGAAQAVLKALLPEGDTRIRGEAKSYSELISASGYAHRPGDFEELCRILDEEVRLITLAVPEHLSNRDRQEPAKPEERYYQLTHDYLVPSVQEWLYQEKRRTRQGRAELRLSALSNSWNKERENRHLPSLWEWREILKRTEKKDWTEPQRRMMKRTGQVYGGRGLGSAAVVAVLVLIGQYFYAAGLVEQLRNAEIARVPQIVHLMRFIHFWIDPGLKRTLTSDKEGSDQKLKASLALLDGGDRSQVPFLEKCLHAASPAELPILRDALRPHRDRLAPQLWSLLSSAKSDDARLLQAASALADYDAFSPRWESVGGKVAQALVSANSIYLGDWLKYLTDVRSKLKPPLATIFRDSKLSESERTQVTNILADYARDDSDLLSDLMLDSEGKHFVDLFEKLKVQQERAVPLLEAELARKPAREATADAQDKLAQRQARAAVALMRLEQGEKVWNLLRHSPDPSVRSYIVNWLRPLGAEPKTLMTRLESLAHKPVSIPKDGKSRMDKILFHPEISERRALILALGRYNLDELSPDKREPLVEHLLKMYRNDPDAGIHGAAEWTLRRWKHDEKLAAIDVELKKLKDRGERPWYVNSEGQTLAVIEGPIEFSMGSPVSEPDRDSWETPHRQPINRRFAIATKEVTKEQYQRFLKENPQIKGLDIDKFSPEPTGPRNGMAWYEAAAYCNWLSRKENLPECYEPNDKEEFAEGMKIVPDALKRPGYRLPTEAEWEYACRAGAVTSRYYGRSVELLEKYAWYSQNSQDRAWSCGQLLPNELGLFDMLGNMYEWCQVQYYPYPEGEVNTTTDDSNILLSINEKYPRLLRGGSFIHPPANVRSASRHRYAPANRSASLGFRLSRTYP